MSFVGCLSKVFTNNRAKMFAAQLDDVKLKFDMCEDAKVKFLAQNLMTLFSVAKSKSLQRQIVADVEHLLDTVNTAQGKYNRLYAEYAPLGKSKADEILDLFMPKRISGMVNRTVHSAPRQVKHLAHFDDFEDIAKMSSIKRYISMNPENKEMTSYLWEKYYLSTLEPEQVKLFKEIDVEFGVKLFTDKKFFANEMSSNYVRYIRDELANFKAASGGTAEFPPLLDVSKFDVMLNREGANGVAVCHKFQNARLAQGGTRIALRSPECIVDSLRHELCHWFDTKVKSIKIGLKKAKISQAEELEMQNAGVTNTYYARTNENEWKAVWGQGSMPKYSPEYKQKMVAKGLPAWIVELDDVYMAKYLKLTTDKNMLKNVDEIEKAYNGRIPNELAIQLLDKPQNSEGINRLLKIKDRFGNKCFECYLDSSDIGKSLSPERLDALERVSKIRVNGENPYEDLMGVMLAYDNLSAKQVQKLCVKLEKYAQKGKTYDLRALFDRYFPLKERLKQAM